MKRQNKNSRHNICDIKQEVISRLKFIGKINKGEKINTLHMFVQPSGICTTISRTFIHQDNRMNTLNFCRDTIHRSFELLITFERSSDSADLLLYNNMVQDLKKAINGLNNLKLTYISDTKFCCDMDTMIEDITSRIDFDEIDSVQSNYESTNSNDTLSPLKDKSKK